MPPHTAAKPTATLKATLSTAWIKRPSSTSRIVSYSKVEKVVYAPTKPTATASLRCGLTLTRSVASVRKKPTTKEPVTL
jgi:hypothetical protein